MLDQFRYDKFFDAPMKFALVSGYAGNYIVIEVIAIQCQFQLPITESNYLASESVSRIKCAPTTVIAITSITL